MANLYYDPEYFGLTIVGMAEDPEGSYEFSMFVVWKDAKGTLYWADDSGCSCPAPFEDFTDTGMLESGTVHQAQQALDEWVASVKEYRPGVQGPAAELHAVLAGL